MSLLLHLETTTKVCSVALFNNQELLCLHESNDDNYKHAELLNVYIEKCLADSGIQATQLDAVSVAEGPGSYTGLRIGCSSAKGLCYGLDIPLLTIKPLKALCYRFLKEVQVDASQNIILFPAIDARRDEIFTQEFSLALNAKSAMQPTVVDEHFFEQFAPAQIALFGDGAAKFEKWFSKHEQVKLYPHIIASAQYNAIEALEKFNKKDFADLAYFEPSYGKEFQTTTSTKLSNVRKHIL